jgi:hypothetical protein
VVQTAGSGASEDQDLPFPPLLWYKCVALAATEAIFDHSKPLLSATYVHAGL